MGLVNLLQIHPINGIALLLSLAVIIWSLYIWRYLRPQPTRLLTGLVGIVAVIQGTRLMQDSASTGGGRAPTVEDFINLTVALIYLASLWTVKRLSIEHLKTEIALRLAEANQALPQFLRRSAVKPDSDDLSRVVLDAAPMPMFAVGLDGNVSCWNRAAERTLGWSRDEVLGQRLPNIVIAPPEDHTAASAGTIRLMRKDGAALDHPVRSVPLRDARGAVNGILTILT